MIINLLLPKIYKKYITECKFTNSVSFSMKIIGVQLMLSLFLLAGAYLTYQDWRKLK